MKKVTSLAAAIAATLLAASAHAGLVGDITGGGIFADDVDSTDGWILENAGDNGVDFWTLSGNAGDTVSITITSDISFGISLYQGAATGSFLEELSFDNDGDFEGLTYVTGTTTLFPDLSSLLLNIVLPSSGSYTLAVGGNNSSFGFSPFAYSMNVEVQPIPVPAAAWLFGSALVGLAAARRRKA